MSTVSATGPERCAYHVTLTTGHVRLSDRSEIARQAAKNLHAKIKELEAELADD